MLFGFAFHIKLQRCSLDRTSSNIKKTTLILMSFLKHPSSHSAAQHQSSTSINDTVLFTSILVWEEIPPQRITIITTTTAATTKSKLTFTSNLLYWTSLSSNAILLREVTGSTLYGLKQPIHVCVIAFSRIFFFKLLK